MCIRFSVKYQEHFILIRPPVLHPDNSYFPHLPKSIILCKCQLIWETSMQLSSSVNQTTLFLLCIAIFCMRSVVFVWENVVTVWTLSSVRCESLSDITWANYFTVMFPTGQMSFTYLPSMYSHLFVNKCTLLNKTKDTVCKVNFSLSWTEISQEVKALVNWLNWILDGTLKIQISCPSLKWFCCFV